MDPNTQRWVGIVFLSLYLVLVLFAATAYIRLANRRWLEAHEAAMFGRLVELQDQPSHQAIRYLLPTPVDKKSPGRWRGILNPADWVGSSEIARWVRLHEAQRIEVSTLSEEDLYARFARAMGQIDELPTVRQIAWQRRWVALQGMSASGSKSSPNAQARWRAELSQLLAELFNARDSTYNQLVSLYGKSGWLILVSYIAVTALFAADFGPVLLAGFLGGLVSRLQLLVYAKGRPTAYGASWVPLFLAPLLGALVAWGGLHLLALLQSLGIASLQTVIPAASNFQGAVSSAILGVAVLLGFSERLFNQLGSHAESVISGDDVAPSAIAAGSPAYPTEDSIGVSRDGATVVLQTSAATNGAQRAITTKRSGPVAPVSNAGQNH